MYVQLYSLDESIGRIVLVDGRAVPDHRAVRLLDGIVVVDHDRFERVLPEDGERYLRWLPLAFTGSFVRAELVLESQRVARETADGCTSASEPEPGCL